MPGLAQFFHLKPSDLDGMHPGEIDTYLGALEDIARNQKQQRG